MNAVEPYQAFLPNWNPGSQQSAIRTGIGSKYSLRENTSSAVKGTPSYTPKIVCTEARGKFVNSR